MSNYTQTTVFTPKDSLPPNNPAKTIFGAAYDVEFGNIATAISSKVDTGTANQIAISGTTVSLAPNIVIAAPPSGIALTITGFAGSSALQILGTGMQIGAPTGGDKGVGTINLSAGAYVNNVPVATSTSGTFIGTLTGCTTSPTATFNYEIVGKHVIVSCISGLNGTSNTTAMGVTGLPVAIQPASTPILGPCVVLNNGNSGTVAQPIVSTSAFNFNLFQTLTGANPVLIQAVANLFTASGTKGIPANWSVVYSLD